MKSDNKSSARAVADLAEGVILATVELAVPPERVFAALASKEVVDWWVRPGVFDTREWTGDVRVGGRWKVSGMGRGAPYAIEGEFLVVDPPRKLVHTWHPPGKPEAASTVSYSLQAIDGGTRLTLRHTGITAPDVCANTGIAWETSLERLAELLPSQAGSAASART
jgi:uncharacterized protein YndB with AHSA1/START domain